MKKKKNWYMDPEELASAIEECQAQGNLPTEKACVMFRTLAEHLICSPKFVGYSRDDRAEMVSAALEKLIRNIKNFKSRFRKSAFAWATRCAEQAFIAFLLKHYKFVNQKKAALERMKSECGEFDPRWEEQLDRAYGED